MRAADPTLLQEAAHPRLSAPTVGVVALSGSVTAHELVEVESRTRLGMGALLDTFNATVAQYVDGLPLPFALPCNVSAGPLSPKAAGGREGSLLPDGPATAGRSIGLDALLQEITPPETIKDPAAPFRPLASWSQEESNGLSSVDSPSARIGNHFSPLVGDFRFPSSSLTAVPVFSAHRIATAALAADGVPMPAALSSLHHRDALSRVPWQRPRPIRVPRRSIGDGKAYLPLVLFLPAYFDIAAEAARLPIQGFVCGSEPDESAAVAWYPAVIDTYEEATRLFSARVTMPLLPPPKGATPVAAPPRGTALVATGVVQKHVSRAGLLLPGEAAASHVELVARAQRDRRYYERRLRLDLYLAMVGDDATERQLGDAALRRVLKLATRGMPPEMQPAIASHVDVLKREYILGIREGRFAYFVLSRYNRMLLAPLDLLFPEDGATSDALPGTDPRARRAAEGPSTGAKAGPSMYTDPCASSRSAAGSPPPHRSGVVAANRAKLLTTLPWREPTRSCLQRMAAHWYQHFSRLALLEVHTYTRGQQIPYDDFVSRCRRTTSAAHNMLQVQYTTDLDCILGEALGTTYSYSYLTADAFFASEFAALFRAIRMEMSLRLRAVATASLDSYARFFALAPLSGAGGFSLAKVIAAAASSQEKGGLTAEGGSPLARSGSGATLTSPKLRLPAFAETSCGLAVYGAASDTYYKVPGLKPRVGPVLVVGLRITEDSGAELTPGLDEIHAALREIVSAAVNATGTVLHLENIIMSSLRLPEAFVPCLASVDDIVVETFATVDAAVRVAGSVVRQVAAVYTRLSFFDDLVAKDEDYFPASDVKDTRRLVHDLEFLETRRDQITWASPPLVHCGALCIDAATARASLLLRCESHRRHVFDVIEAKVASVAAAVCKEFVAIDERLQQRPSSAEDMQELMAFTATALTRLEAVETVDCRQAVALIGVTEKFFCVLPDDVVNLVTEMFAWPAKLDARFAESEARVQRERQSMVEDLNHYRDSLKDFLETITEKVNELHFIYEAEKAEETEKKIRAIRKQLEDLDQKIVVLHRREEIFDLEPTVFSSLPSLEHCFGAYEQFWIVFNQATYGVQAHLEQPLQSLSADRFTDDLETWRRLLRAATRSLRGYPEIFALGRRTEAWISRYTETTLLAQALKVPGLRLSHWTEISRRVGAAAPGGGIVELTPTDTGLTLQRLLAFNAQAQLAAIEEIALSAAQEFEEESRLEHMRAECRGLHLAFRFVDENGVDNLRVMTNASETITLLDQQIAAVQQLRASPHIGSHLQQALEWEAAMTRLQETLGMWATVQAQWLQLRPVIAQTKREGESNTTGANEPLSSSDAGIINQFVHADDIFRSLVDELDRPQHSLFTVMTLESLPPKLNDVAVLLQSVRAGVLSLMDAKRVVFPRFFFVSNDDLLACLNGANLSAVSALLPKLYYKLQSLEASRGEVAGFIASDGTQLRNDVTLAASPEPIESWLLKMDKALDHSLRGSLEMCMKDYSKTALREWIFRWSGQMIDLVQRIKFTQELQEVVAASSTKGLQAYVKKMTRILHEYFTVAELRKTMKPSEAKAVANAIVGDMERRETVIAMLDDGVSSLDEVAAFPHFRTSIDSYGQIAVTYMHVQARYGFEYLGTVANALPSPGFVQAQSALFLSAMSSLASMAVGNQASGKSVLVSDMTRMLARMLWTVQCLPNQQTAFDHIAMLLRGCLTIGAWLLIDDIDLWDAAQSHRLFQIVERVITARKSGSMQVLFDFHQSIESRVDPNFCIVATTSRTFESLPAHVIQMFRPLHVYAPDWYAVAKMLLCASGFESTSVALGDQLGSLFSAGALVDPAVFTMRTMRAVVNEASLDARAKEGPEVAVARAVALLVPARDAALQSYVESWIRDVAGVGEVAAIRDATRSVDVRVSAAATRPLIIVGPPFSGKGAAVRAHLAALQASNPAAPTPVVHVVVPRALTAAMLFGVPASLDPSAATATTPSAASAPSNLQLPTGGSSSSGEFGGGAVPWPNATQHGAAIGVIESIALDCADSPLRPHVILFDGDPRGTDDLVWSVLAEPHRRPIPMLSGSTVILGPQTTVVFKSESLTHATPRVATMCAVICTGAPKPWADVLAEDLAYMSGPLAAEPAARAVIRSAADLLVPELQSFCEGGGNGVRLAISQACLILHRSLVVLGNQSLQSRSASLDFKERFLPLALQCFLFGLTWAFGGALPFADRAALEHTIRGLNDQIGALLPANVHDAGVPLEPLPTTEFSIFDCGVTLAGWRRFLGDPSDAAAPPAATGAAREPVQKLAQPSLGVDVAVEDLRVMYGELPTLACAVDCFVGLGVSVVLTGDRGCGTTSFLRSLQSAYAGSTTAIHMIAVAPGVTSRDLIVDVAPRLGRRKAALAGPLSAKRLVICVDDVHLCDKLEPETPEGCFHSPVFELLYALWHHRQWYMPDVGTVSIADTSVVATAKSSNRAELNELLSVSRMRHAVRLHVTAPNATEEEQMITTLFASCVAVSGLGAIGREAARFAMLIRGTVGEAPRAPPTDPMMMSSSMIFAAPPLRTHSNMVSGRLPSVAISWGGVHAAFTQATAMVLRASNLSEQAASRCIAAEALRVYTAGGGSDVPRIAQRIELAAQQCFASYRGEGSPRSGAAGEDSRRPTLTSPLAEGSAESDQLSVSANPAQLFGPPSGIVLFDDQGGVERLAPEEACRRAVEWIDVFNNDPPQEIAAVDSSLVTTLGREASMYVSSKRQAAFKEGHPSISFAKIPRVNSLTSGSATPLMKSNSGGFPSAARNGTSRSMRTPVLQVESTTWLGDLVLRLVGHLQAPCSHVGLVGGARFGLSRLAAISFSVLNHDVMVVGRGQGRYDLESWRRDVKHVLRLAAKKNARIGLFLPWDVIRVEPMVLRTLDAIIRGGAPIGLLTADEWAPLLDAVRLNEKTDPHAALRRRLRTNLRFVLHFPTKQHLEEVASLFPFATQLVAQDVDTPFRNEQLYEFAAKVLDAGRLDRRRGLSIAEAISEIFSEISIRNVLSDQCTTTAKFLALCRFIASVYRRRVPEVKRLLESGSSLTTTVSALHTETEALRARKAVLTPDLTALVNKILEDEVTVEKLSKEIETNRAAFDKMEAEAVVSVSAIESKKHSIAQVNDGAMSLINEARRALSEMDVKQMTNLRLTTAPPQKIKQVMEAMCLLLNERPERTARGATGDYWAMARRLMEDPEFMQRLITLPLDVATMPALDRLQPFVDVFEATRYANVSVFAQAVADLVVASFSWLRSHSQMQSLQDEVDNARLQMLNTVDELEKRRDALTGANRQLVQLRTTLETLRTQRARLQEEIDACNKRYTNASTITTLITKLAARWETERSLAATLNETLIGNIVLCGVNVMLAGSVDDSDWRACHEICAKVLGKHSINCSPPGDRSFSLTATMSSDHRPLQHEMRGVVLPQKFVAALCCIHHRLYVQWPLYVTASPTFVDVVEQQLGVGCHDVARVSFYDPTLNDRVGWAMSSGMGIIVADFSGEMPPSWRSLLQLPPVLSALQEGHTVSMPWYGRSVDVRKSFFLVLLVRERALILGQAAHSTALSDAVTTTCFDDDLLVEEELLQRCLQNRVTGAAAISTEFFSEMNEVQRSEEDRVRSSDVVAALVTSHGGGMVDNEALILELTNEVRCVDNAASRSHDARLRATKLNNSRRMRWLRVARTMRSAVECLTTMCRLARITPRMESVYDLALKSFTVNKYVSGLISPAKLPQLTDEDQSRAVALTFCQSLFETYASGWDTAVRRRLFAAMLGLLMAASDLEVSGGGATTDAAAQAAQRSAATAADDGARSASTHHGSFSFYEDLAGRSTTDEPTDEPTSPQQAANREARAMACPPYTPRILRVAVALAVDLPLEHSAQQRCEQLAKVLATTVSTDAMGSNSKQRLAAFINFLKGTTIPPTEGPHCMERCISLFPEFPFRVIFAVLLDAESLPGSRVIQQCEGLLAQFGGCLLPRRIDEAAYGAFSDLRIETRVPMQAAAASGSAALPLLVRCSDVPATLRVLRRMAASQGHNFALAPPLSQTIGCASAVALSDILLAQLESSRAQTTWVAVRLQARPRLASDPSLVEEAAAFVQDDGNAPHVRRRRRRTGGGALAAARRRGSTAVNAAAAAAAWASSAVEVAVATFRTQARWDGTQPLLSDSLTAEALAGRLGISLSLPPALALAEAVVSSRGALAAAASPSTVVVPAAKTEGAATTFILWVLYTDDDVAADPVGFRALSARCLPVALLPSTVRDEAAMCIAIGPALPRDWRDVAAASPALRRTIQGLLFLHCCVQHRTRQQHNGLARAWIDAVYANDADLSALFHLLRDGLQLLSALVRDPAALARRLALALLPCRCVNQCDVQRLRSLIYAFIGPALVSRKGFSFGGVFPANDSDLTELGARLAATTGDLHEIALLDGHAAHLRRRPLRTPREDRPESPSSRQLQLGESQRREPRPPPPRLPTGADSVIDFAFSSSRLQRPHSSGGAHQHGRGFATATVGNLRPPEEVMSHPLWTLLGPPAELPGVFLEGEAGVATSNDINNSSEASPSPTANFGVSGTAASSQAFLLSESGQSFTSPTAPMPPPAATSNAAFITWLPSALAPPLISTAAQSVSSVALGSLERPDLFVAVWYAGMRHDLLHSTAAASVQLHAAVLLGNAMHAATELLRAGDCVLQGATLSHSAFSGFPAGDATEGAAPHHPRAPGCVAFSVSSRAPFIVVLRCVPIGAAGAPLSLEDQFAHPASAMRSDDGGSRRLSATDPPRRRSVVGAPAAGRPVCDVFVGRAPAALYAVSDWDRAESDAAALPPLAGAHARATAAATAFLDTAWHNAPPLPRVAEVGFSVERPAAPAGRSPEALEVSPTTPRAAASLRLPSPAAKSAAAIPPHRLPAPPPSTPPLTSIFSARRPSLDRQQGPAARRTSTTAATLTPMPPPSGTSLETLPRLAPSMAMPSLGAASFTAGGRSEPSTTAASSAVFDASTRLPIFVSTELGAEETPFGQHEDTLYDLYAGSCFAIFA